MEKAYKGMVGYNICKEDGDKHPPTHIILSLDEYDDFCSLLAAEKTKASNSQKLQYQAEDRMRNEIEQSNKDAEVRIENYRRSLDDELQRLREEKLIAEKLNETLISIMKNRANSKRGIKPKKQHDGYIVLRSDQIDFVLQLSKKEKKRYHYGELQYRLL